MTKTLKKCLLAVMMFGLAIACALVGFNATRAFADLTTNQQKFVDDYAAFLEIADANEDGELSVAEIEGVKGNAAADAKFLSMYMYISNLAGGAAPEDAEYV